jgi:hypothetical protein
MNKARQSRVSDIRAFAEEVVRTLAERPALDGPTAAAAWLGDVETVVGGEDASAKRRLACRLIALGLAGDDDRETDEYADLVAEACATTIAEMNRIVARLQGALVSFGEEAVWIHELAVAAETMRTALSDGGEGLRVTTY